MAFARAFFARFKYKQQACCERSIVPFADVLLPQIAQPLLPVILAILLYAKKDAESPDALTEVPFRVESTPGKGYGAFATRDFERGEIICSEMPLLVWPSKLDAHEAQSLVSQLAPRAKEIFYGLANNQPPSSKLDETLAIRATNAFNVQLPPIPQEIVSTRDQAEYAVHRNPSHASFLFPRVARINHSCLPNADHAIDWSTLQMTVYATTPIKANEEICIEYQSGFVQQTAAQRSKRLRDSFSFDCGCTLCSNPSLVGASDARRTEISSIVRQVAAAGAIKDRQAVARGFERIRGLLEEEGYKAMPEFDDPNVSSAFAYYATMMREK